MSGRAFVLFTIVTTLATTGSARGVDGGTKAFTAKPGKMPEQSDLLTQMPPPEVVFTPPTEEAIYEWYGGVNLLLTLVADGLLVAGSVLLATSEGDFDTPTTLMIAGLSTHVLSGPVAHIFEGNVGRAFGSLVLRLGLPSLAALAGAGIGADGMDDGRRPFGATAGTIWGGVIGLGVGVLLSQLIDIIALPWEPADPS